MIKIPPISPQTDNIHQSAWFLEQVRRAIQELQDDSWTYIHLPANYSNSTNTLTNVTSLGFTGETNTIYEIEVLGAYQTTNALPGLSLSLTIPTGATQTGITQTLVPTTDKCVNSKWIVNMGPSSGAIQLQMASDVNGVDVTLQEGLFFLKYRKI